MSTETCPDLSTLPPDPSPRWSTFDRWLRRIASIAIAATALAALAGVLGVRTATATSSADGYDLEVRYARVSRAGLETPFTIDVRAGSGRLPDSVTLRIDTAYLGIFDENGLDPQPASAFSDSVETEWTFDGPVQRGELSVDFDARLSPAVQWGREGRVVLVLDGEEVTSVVFKTWVMP